MSNNERMKELLFIYLLNNIAIMQTRHSLEGLQLHQPKTRSRMGESGGEAGTIDIVTDCDTLELPRSRATIWPSPVPSRPKLRHKSAKYTHISLVSVCIDII